MLQSISVSNVKQHITMILKDLLTLKTRVIDAKNSALPSQKCYILKCINIEYIFKMTFIFSNIPVLQHFLSNACSLGERKRLLSTSIDLILLTLLIPKENVTAEPTTQWIKQNIY